MRFFHLSDLHIGKHLHFYNLAEDQSYILEEIVKKAVTYRPDAIVIAGDIYDKSVPSGEAYRLFDSFLNMLADITPAIPVLIIAGNHDSAERLQYASSFLEKHQIYIAVQPPMEEGEHLKKITFQDAYGEVDFYLLPFTKPGYVRQLFGAGEVTDYESAYRLLLEREEIAYEEKRNVLVAHQFFVSEGKQPETCDSELLSLNIGGLDAIDTRVISGFDYVALGHIHGPQTLAGGKIRYAGTPLKYSVSEAGHNKSITMVTLTAKGEPPVIETIPLEPMRDVRKLRGTMQELMKADKTDDYVSIVLTDEKEPYRPKDTLEEVYGHILEITLDNQRTRQIQEQLYASDGSMEKLPGPMEAFQEFYQLMNSQPMAAEESSLIAEILEQLEEQQL